MKSRTRIMIVEDEFIAARSEKRSLEELGYTVSAKVASGEEAVKKAEEDKPDLVLMDINLKGKMDGIEAAGIIRSRFDIPSIFVTAYSDAKLLERAKITEPFGYLIKPFENREILCNIEIALYKHRAETERKKLVQELKDSLAKIKFLSGMLPICANCKKIRDDNGYWEQIESYIEDRSEAVFSHSVCPECYKKLYPDLYPPNQDLKKDQ
jgi:CheY-like chemotaxis protein